MGLDPNESYSLSELSKVSGVPVSILKEVEKRAGGAYANNLLSVRLKDGSKNFNPSIGASGRMSINQWKSGRVFSFLNKGTTYRTSDKDLAKKADY